MSNLATQIEHIEVEPGVHLAVQGPTSSDKPVVMLSNSVGAAMGMWDEVVEHLSGELRFIRYDTRGHGRSDVPSGACTIAHLGRDAIAILDAMKVQRAIFCGLSLGGLTGQWLGVNEARRFDGLVLANTAANFPPASMWQQRADAVRADGMTVLVKPTIERWFTERFRTSDKARTQEIAEMFAATPVEGYAACCGVLASSDLEPNLHQIACPVRVICGAHDPSTPPSRGEELVAGLREGTMVTLDAAHISAVEASRAFADELLAFVRHVASRTN